jgi:N-hydroxyarylamine O-acetyltransferase
LDTGAYLARIGYQGPLKPSPETLRALHVAHLLSIPFENLDIHLGRRIVLDEAALFRKVVEERRGGFCYELNGLFAVLLRQIGFEVTLLSAGVAHAEGGFGPEFDHMVLLVRAGTDWLADVGFGECFPEPLPLCGNDGEYRLIEDAPYVTLLRGDAPEYRFTLVPRSLGDYAGMCHYHQTSPASSFTQGRMCTRATPDGRITLTDHRLIVTRDGRREERAVNTEDDFRALLAAHFGITL